jgi:hypothetical protein
MRSVLRSNTHCTRGCDFHAESVALIILHHSATMDVEEAVCLWVLYRRMQRRRQRYRGYWIHPIFRDRLTASLYVTLYPNLQQYEPKLFSYFRMSVTSFDNLLELIREEITTDANAIRHFISPEEKLIVTLR